MDHWPFEDWILNNQALDAAEKRQLDSHLQGCSHCSALSEVNLTLKSVSMAAPVTGFADRFQVRLAEQKKTMRRRNFLGFLLLTVSVLGVLTIIGWPVIMSLLHAPVDLLGSWLGSLLSFWVSLDAMAHAGLVLFRIAPGFIPAYIWTVILFSACGWSLLWVFTLIKYSKVSQGV